MAKRKRKNKKFRKALLIWTLILLILGEIVLIYVDRVLVEYEKGNVNNYLDSLVADIKSQALKGNIEKYFTLDDIKSDYEKDSSLKKGYKELFKDAKEVTYTKCKDCSEENSYTLTVDGRSIANINLDGSKLKEALFILNYNVWEVKNIEVLNKGIYDIDLYLDNNLNLKINGNSIKESDIVESTPVKGYEDFKDYENTPKLNHYQISNLTRKPNIEITDKDGKKFEYTIEDGKYYATNFYKTDDNEDAMKHLENEFDALAFAELWSKFLTADLTGTYYGYYQITPYVIEGTSMSKQAYNWAHNVDIKFVSNHYLENPPFTNEKLSNFTIYNPNAFSVDVYLEKNMVLTSSRSKRVDKMNDTMYFAYIDGAWKISSIVSKAE